jgi:AraC-like DNA-binding protein
MNDRFNKEGTFYTLSPLRGRGHYWMYVYPDRFAITVQDFVFHEDEYMEFVAPECIVLSCYDSVSGAELQPYKPFSHSCLNISIGRNGVHKTIFHKHVPIRCMSIILMPEYYRSALPLRYPNEFSDPEAVFLQINGLADYPEIIQIWRQIQNCRYTGTAAKLFFEGKVTEAISLVLHRAGDGHLRVSPARVSQQDMEHLAVVEAYIREHYADSISLETLARMACMSPSKLKYTFKSAYNCTIHTYLVRERMRQAEQWLAANDLSIEEISKRVGYRKASHFANTFRQSTGLLPSEYRKRLMLS